MTQSTEIELTKIPKEKDYEDYLCAFLQSGGLYVERSIIYREVEELLELDIIATDFQRDSAKNNLVEIKSGNWGFSEIFKIRGWMTYLQFQQGAFIVQETRPSISYFRNKAKELKIDLIDNSDLTKTVETLKDFLCLTPEDADVETIRFAYLLERKQLQRIKKLKKANPHIESYSGLDDYFFKVNSGSFFTRDPIERINQLFRNYLKYKNITARVCNELNGGDFKDVNVTELSSKCYKDVFYQAEDSILHISLYIEHLARLTILKCAIEHLIGKLDGNVSETNVRNQLDYMLLPNNLKIGLSEIVKDDYFYLYPRFWQFFTYVLGGFVLTDILKQEYELIQSRTGIPVDEIPKAFMAFNHLFPREGGWLFKIPNSSIEFHSLFPITFSGIGANYRRMIYTQDKTYKTLQSMLSQDKTMVDLGKWNNLAYTMLKPTLPTD